MNYNIILFCLLVIIFIVIITLSIKLGNLKRSRLLPCTNPNINKINIIDEYQESLNDIGHKSELTNRSKKIKFNDTVQVRVFG
jgi:hypothetical protein